jgi:uncharacterized coiled-coil protein SlyX
MNAQLNKLQVVMVVSLLVLVGYFAFMLGNKRTESEISKFRTEYQAILLRADTLTKVSDSLRSQSVRLSETAAAKDTTIARLNTTVTRGRRETAYLSSQLKNLEISMRDSVILSDTSRLLGLKDSAISNLKDQVEIKDGLILAQDSIIQIKTTQISLLNEALVISTARGDGLQAFIDSLPPAPRDPNKLWGKISKPSRKTVAVVSFVAGVLTTAAIAK